jgi:hypothetical protein
MEFGTLKDLYHPKGLTDNKNNLISPVNRTPNQNFINHGLQIDLNDDTCGKNENSPDDLEQQALNKSTTSITDAA